jgi:large subunit ribosomal protein L3
MTQIFDQNGKLVPVTVLELGPNLVLQVKRQDGKDGYNAIKVAYGDVKPARVNRPEMGVFKAANAMPHRVVREMRVRPDYIADFNPGDTLTVAMFEPGERVDVCGISKGKGFQGVIKRHHFKGAKEFTHGTHEYRRHGGSIGSSAYPSRVIPGKRMAGHMGNRQVTAIGLTIVAVIPDQNLMLVEGAVPGPKNGMVRAMVSGRQPTFL